MQQTQISCISPSFSTFRWPKTSSTKLIHCDVKCKNFFAWLLGSGQGWVSAGADSAGEASPAPSSSTQRAQWLEEMLWWACIALCLGAASCIVLLERCLKPLQRQNWGKCREVLLFEVAWRLRARKQWVSQAFWSVFLTLQSILLNPWHNSVLKFVCKARNAHYMTQVEVSRSSFCLRIVVCPVALLHAQLICPTKVERSFSSKLTSALWSSPAVLRERRMQGRHWV